jgi:hypothetical protein
MIHKIGSPEWFKATDPRYKDIIIAWLLGANVECRSVQNNLWLVMNDAKITTSFGSTERSEGWPFNTNSNFEWEYRLHA